MLCARSPVSNLFSAPFFTLRAPATEFSKADGVGETNEHWCDFHTKGWKIQYSIVIRYVCFVFCAINFYAHSTFFWVHTDSQLTHTRRWPHRRWIYKKKINILKSATRNWYNGHIHRRFVRKNRRDNDTFGVDGDYYLTRRRISTFSVPRATERVYTPVYSRSSMIGAHVFLRAAVPRVTGFRLFLYGVLFVLDCIYALHLNTLGSCIFHCLTRSDFYLKKIFCFQLYRMSYLLNGLFVALFLSLSLTPHPLDKEFNGILSCSKRFGAK